MGSTIRARVKGGVLEPIEPLEIADGNEVELAIVAVQRQPNMDAFRRAFGSWAGTLNADQLIRDIYEDRLITTRPEPRI